VTLPEFESATAVPAGAKALAAVTDAVPAGEMAIRREQARRKKDVCNSLIF